MTKEDAIERFEKVSDSAINSPDRCDVISLNESIEIVKDIYNYFENKDCNGCKYYLSDNGNYPLEPCGSCTRFYYDMWEAKWKI